MTVGHQERQTRFEAIRERANADETARYWGGKLFGQAPDGVSISRAGRILYANERMHELIGAHDGDVVGRASLELYPAVEYASVLAQIQAMVFSGQPQAPARYRALCVDGSVVPVEVTRFLLRLPDEPLVIEVMRSLSPTGDAAPGDGPMGDGPSADSASR